MSDPFYGSVSLLCRFDGSNGGTTFTDDSNNALTPSAHSVATTGTTTVKFGTAAMVLAADGYVRWANYTGFDYGTGDFTIEFWFNTTNASAQQQMMDTRPGVNALGIVYLVGGAVRYYCNTADRILGAASSVTANAWHHVALVRISGSTKLYLDGVQQGSAFADTNNYNGSAISFGEDYLASAGFGFRGSMDDLRITKGVGRYTANFTPPTATYDGPAPTVTGTIASTEAQDSVSIVGVVQTQLYTVQGKNVLAASGSNSISGSAATATKNTSAISGTVSITGAASLAQQPNYAGLFTVAPRVINKAQTLLGFAPVAATQTGTPPSDPFYGDVVLLLHNDVADSAIIFPDNSPKNRWITVFGNTTGSSSTPEFGAGSAFGTTGGMYTPDDGGSDFSFSGADWTIEGWAKTNSSGINQALVALPPAGGGSPQILLTVNSGAQLVVVCSSGGSSVGSVGSGATTVATNTWFHWAVSCVGTTIYIFLNGVLKSSGTLTGLIGASGYAVIGSSGVGPSLSPWHGWIDEVRITKNAGRYTSTFSVPTAAYPDSGSLSVLNAAAAQTIVPFVVLQQAFGAGGRSVVASTTMDPITQVALVSAPSRIISASTTLDLIASTGAIITTSDRNLIVPGDPYYGEVAYLVHGDSMSTVSGVNKFVDSGPNALTTVQGTINSIITDSFAIGGKAIAFAKVSGSYIENVSPITAADRTTSTTEMRVRFDTLTDLVVGVPVPGSPGDYTFDPTLQQTGWFFTSSSGLGGFFSMTLGLAGAGGLYQADWTSISGAGSSINFAPYVLQLKGTFEQLSDITHTQHPFSFVGTHEVVVGWHTISVNRSTTSIEIYLDGVLDITIPWSTDNTFFDETFIAGADITRGFAFQPGHTNLSAIQELRHTFGVARNQVIYPPSTIPFPAAFVVMDPITQVASAAHFASVSAAQTIPAFAQSAFIFSATAGRSASATQTLGAFTQVATASLVGVRQLGTTQQMDPFVQAAYIAPTRLIDVWNQVQPNFLGGGGISTSEAATAAQLLTLTQTATARHSSIQATQGAVLPAFGQVATAAAILQLVEGQILLPPAQSATIGSVRGIVGNQLLAPFIPTTSVLSDFISFTPRGYKVTPEVRTFICND